MSDGKDKASAKAKGEKGERKPPVNKTLFVRNLPETFDNQKLEQLFEDIGPIKRAFVVKKQDEPGCRGYGYVQFAVDKDAKNALLKLQGKPVAPKKLLLLDWAKQRPAKEERLQRRGKGSAKPAKTTSAPSLNKVIKFGEEDSSDDEEEDSSEDQTPKKKDKKKVKKEQESDDEDEEDEEDEEELDSEEEEKRELKELRALKGKKLDLSEFEPGTQDSDDIESRVRLNFRDYFNDDDFSDGEYEKAMSEFKKALEESDDSEGEASDDEDAKAKKKKKKKKTKEVKKEKKEDEPVKDKKKKKKKKEEEKKKTSKKVASDDDKDSDDSDEEDNKNDSQKNKKTPRLDPERLILIEKMNYFIKEEDIRRILKKEHLNCSKMTLEEEKNEDNPDDDENNITARLLMASPEQALQAIALLEKTKVRGRTLQPKLMAEISKRSRLIVRNLSFGVTEKKLRKVFGAHGTITDIHIPKNAEGTSKGFAFVQFERMNSATKAVEKANGFKLLGRPMAVDFSLPKHQFLKVQTMEKIAKLEEKAIDETEELIKLARANDPETFKSSSIKTEAGDKNSKTTIKTTIKTEKMSDDEGDIPEVVVKDEKLDDDEDEDDDDFNDDDHEEDEEDEEDEKEMDDIEKHHVDPTRPKPKLISNDVVKGTTLFIRNLAFDTTDQSLQDKFNEFGPLRFGVVVKNKETGQSKGSAFVQFKELKDADNCLRLAYPQFAKYIYKEPAEPTLEDKRKQKKSIEKLVEEWAAKCQRLKDQEIKEFKKVRESEIFLDGRALIITRAVDRSTAGKLSNRIDGDTKYFESDKRNIYLAKEGLITMEDPVAATIPPAEMKKRQKLWNETKEKLKNVNFKVSDTRISILNIPKTVDETKLREIAQRAFKVPTKIIQSKIVREKDRFDKDGKPASKGFGFVEFRKHEDALRALRFLNNNPDIFSETVRPIVTFAIDNTFKLQRHERAKEFGARKTKTGAEGEDEDEEQESAKEKKKKNRGAKQREKKRLRSEAGLSSSSSSSSSDGQQPPAKVHKPTASSTVSSASAQKPQKKGAQPSQTQKGAIAQKPAAPKKKKKNEVVAGGAAGARESQGIVPSKYTLPSAPGITEAERKDKKKKKKVDNFDQLVANFQKTFTSTAKQGHWYDQ